MSVAEYSAPVELQPVFIMGPHRSGTTILYQLLASTGCFNVTTVFHLLNRDELQRFHFNPAVGEARRDQLVRLLEDRGISTRKYDSVQVSPDLPRNMLLLCGRKAGGPSSRPGISQTSCNLPTTYSAFRIPPVHCY